MNLLGSAEITSVESPNQLEFTAARQRGWIDLALPAAILLVFFALSWAHHYWILAVMAALGTLSLIPYWIYGSVTTLTVSSGELVTRSSTGTLFRTETRVPSAEVDSIGFSAGAGDDPPGLYAQRGWRPTCLLPGLSEQQASSIAEDIRRKFPDLEHGDRTPTSLLHGDQSGLQTLGKL